MEQCTDFVLATALQTKFLLSSKFLRIMWVS